MKKLKTGLDVNVEQGKSPIWCNSRCARCGRRPHESILNIEAIIHHNAKQLVCVDHDSCSKFSKRRKR